MPIDDEQLLRDEYFQLQKTVEDFDGRSLTIKAWSATLSTSGIGLAYQQKNTNLLLAAAAAAIAFWLIDWVWKLHQQAFYPRLQALEAWFAETPRSATTRPPALQIMDNWRRAVRTRAGRWRRWVVAWWQPGVSLPHLVVATIALLLWMSGDGRWGRLAGWLQY
jgi:hypothetical protein